MNAENVSAFAAYQSESVEEPNPDIMKDRSFQDLTRNEMIAHLISKKKQELKRKKIACEPQDAKPKKVKKPNKNGTSKSAPVSQNNSFSHTEKTSESSNGHWKEFASPEKVKAVKVVSIRMWLELLLNIYFIIHLAQQKSSICNKKNG